MLLAVPILLTLFGVVAVWIWPKLTPEILVGLALCSMVRINMGFGGLDPWWAATASAATYQVHHRLLRPTHHRTYGTAAFFVCYASLVAGAWSLVLLSYDRTIMDQEGYRSGTTRILVQMVSHAMLWLAFVVVGNTAWGTGRGSAFARRLTLIVGALCLIGFCQWAGFRLWGTPSWGTYRGTFGDPSVEHVVAQDGIFRVSSLCSEPKALGTLLATIIPFCLVTAAIDRGRLFYFVLLPLMLVCGLLTYSTSMLMLLPVGCVVAAVVLVLYCVRWPTPHGQLAATILFVVAAAGTLAQVESRGELGNLSPFARSANVTRFSGGRALAEYIEDSDRAVLGMFFAEPETALIGVGPGVAGLKARHYLPAYASYASAGIFDAKNTFLRFASYYGIVLTAWLFYRIFRDAWHCVTSRESYLVGVLGLLLSVASLLTNVGVLFVVWGVLRNERLLHEPGPGRQVVQRTVSARVGRQDNA